MIHSTVTPKSEAKTRWQRFVEHKESSTNFIQRQSIFLGIDVKTEARVDLPRSAFKDGHIWIDGTTGSGKSHVTLLSIILQAIRGYRKEDGQRAPKEPVIIFDLKGDEALFHAVKEAAEKDDRVFRFLSTQKNDGFHFFDPFQTLGHEHVTPMRLATQLIRSFSLDYGLTYGGLYFTDQNLILLLHAIKEIRNDGGAFTIQRLTNTLTKLARKSTYADARHVHLCLEKLAEYPQINISEYDHLPADHIDMVRALENGEVLYFYFKMNDEAPTLRQIAALALHSLENAAQSFPARGRPAPFTHVIVDEFYHIAGKGFGELLSTVRSVGLHCVLANQDRGQLESTDPTLPRVVETNTSVKKSYTANDKEAVERWKRFSGPKIDFNRSHSINPREIFPRSDSLQGYSEIRDWQLSDDEIVAMNDSRAQSLLYVNDGSAKSPGNRVRIVQGLYPIFEWQYLKYSQTPIPQTPRPERRTSDASRPKPEIDTGKAKASPRGNWVAPEQELQKRMESTWNLIAAEEPTENLN